MVGFFFYYTKFFILGKLFSSAKRLNSGMLSKYLSLKSLDFAYVFGGAVAKVKL